MEVAKPPFDDNTGKLPDANGEDVVADISVVVQSAAGGAP